MYGWVSVFSVHKTTEQVPNCIVYVLRRLFRISRITHHSVGNTRPPRTPAACTKQADALPYIRSKLIHILPG